MNPILPISLSFLRSLAKPRSLRIGPVKIQNWSTTKSPRRQFLEKQTQQPRAQTGDDRDLLADDLEMLFNRYLTVAYWRA